MNNSYLFSHENKKWAISAQKHDPKNLIVNKKNPTPRLPLCGEGGKNDYKKIPPNLPLRKGGDEILLFQKERLGEILKLKPREIKKHSA